jgi:peptidoglycan LD-endopeptidase LytH
MPKAEWKRTARIFGIGAACGFVAGAALVAVLISRYGPSTRTAIDSPSSTVSSDAGLADLDSPAVDQPPGKPSGTSGTRPAEPATSITAAPPAALADRSLEIPVEGVKPEQLVRSFEEQRSGRRSHEAIDILAPRNTPVKAVENGKIARLFESKAGGNTIYQFDPTGQFCYYYAHLERYAAGLHEGDTVEKGQVIGYVGTSGNAPPGTPHLHFAIFKLTADKHWWEGTPIDPYDILR